MPTGANQYNKKTGATVQIDDQLLSGVAGMFRCGDVWGTQCRSWVRPPAYRHGTHPALVHLVRKITSADCPTEILLSILEQRRTFDLKILEHPNVPTETIDRYVLMKINAIPPPVDFIPGSCNPNISPHVLENLYRVIKDAVPSNSSVWRFLSNPSCPDSIISAWIQGASVKDHKACSYLLNNHAVSSQNLQLLWDLQGKDLSNASQSVGAALAQHPNLPVQILEPLAYSGFGTHVARHPACPPDLLHSLSLYTISIRRIIALHPNCRADTLEFIYQHTKSHYSYRDTAKSILEHPDCPKSVILDCVHSPVTSIALAASLALERYPELKAIVALST